jgi:hypothetical protein
MVARDQPIMAVPFVGVGVAGLDLCAGGAEREYVDARVEGRVAVDLDRSRIDRSDRLVFEEVMEVVLLLCNDPAVSAQVTLLI